MEHENEGGGYKSKYRTLKRKLKSLVYEHEMLNDQLDKSQKKLLRVSRDRSFLLDRMLQYEKVNDSSSDSEVTDMSDSDNEKPVVKKKLSPAETAPPPEKKKKATKKKTPKKQPQMTSEELERRLESRPVKPAIEKATTAMPSEIFSTEKIEGDSDEMSEGEIDLDRKGLIMDIKSH